MKRFLFGLAATTLLASCGIPGSLERAPPLWNRDEQLRHECERPLNRGETRDPRCNEATQQPQANPAQ